jgi:assimilatory nitrate reductase catalytic subunit
MVSDCWPTDTTRFAHVMLPAAGWGEKDGTVTNSELRISPQRPFRVPPGEARSDWWMFAEVGRRLGFAEHFAWQNPAAVFREHAALSGFENDGARVFDISALAELDDAEYDALHPVRWPLPAGAHGEGGRLFATGGFPTPDGRARMVPVRTPTPREAALTLNTGRVRDQWHTMTRTGRVPMLVQHTPEPRIALHPADAARIGLSDGALARIETAEGAMVLRAELTHAQRRGETFAPMHWTDAFASSGPVGRVVGAAPDPISGQPALKSTPVRIAPATERLHGVLLRQSGGALHEFCRWVRVPVENGQLYRLSFAGDLPDSAMVRALMPEGEERLEVLDAGRGTLRAAAITGGRLVAALFVAPEAARLPRAKAVAALLGATVAEAARATLLAGRAGEGAAEEGPRICACFSICRSDPARDRHARARQRGRARPAPAGRDEPRLLRS